MVANAIRQFLVFTLMAVGCYATFGRTDYENFANKWNLDSDSFFGMKFVLNVTGKACIPQWTEKPPKCWNHWPWPWPNPGKSTTKKYQTSTSTKVTTRTATTTQPKSSTKILSLGTSTIGGSTTTRIPGTSTTTRVQSSSSTTTTQATSTTTRVSESSSTIGSQSSSTTTSGTTTRTLPTSTSTENSIPTTTTTTSTSTSSQSTPTSPSGSVETTTCQYALDIQDDAFCKDIRGVIQKQGSLQACAPYYDNATIMQYYETCRQFQCKYQRAYRCYGMLPFVNDCKSKLPEDQSLYGWRQYNFCDANSTPFPAVTFTDIPSTQATVAVAKRNAGWNQDDDKYKNNGKGNYMSTTNNDSSQSDESEEITDEGTTSPAGGIKYNWCVPKIFSWSHQYSGKPINGGGKFYVSKSKKRRRRRKENKKAKENKY